MRHGDYRDVAEGGFDAVSSIGLTEHIGVANYPAYFRFLRGRLRPGGRLLNHCITRPDNVQTARVRGGFIDRYVFPDGELTGSGRIIATIQDVGGLEVRHEENLREHYAKTCARVVREPRRALGRVRPEVGEATAKVWGLYLAGSRVGFERNWIQLHQVLAVKLHEDGARGLPAASGLGLRLTPGRGPRAARVAGAAGPGPVALVGSGEYLPVLEFLERALITGRPRGTPSSRRRQRPRDRRRWPVGTRSARTPPGASASSRWSCPSGTGTTPTTPATPSSSPAPAWSTSPAAVPATSPRRCAAPGSGRRSSTRGGTARRSRAAPPARWRSPPASPGSAARGGPPPGSGSFRWSGSSRTSTGSGAACRTSRCAASAHGDDAALLVGIDEETALVGGLDGRLAGRRRRARATRGRCSAGGRRGCWGRAAGRRVAAGESVVLPVPAARLTDVRGRPRDLRTAPRGAHDPGMTSDHSRPRPTPGESVWGDESGVVDAVLEWVARAPRQGHRSDDDRAPGRGADGGDRADGDPGGHRPPPRTGDLRARSSCPRPGPRRTRSTSPTSRRRRPAPPSRSTSPPAWRTSSAATGRPARARSTPRTRCSRWLAGLLGWPATAGGTFVSGGTTGNLSALVAARHTAEQRRRAAGPAAHPRGRLGARLHRRGALLGPLRRARDGRRRCWRCRVTTAAG